MRSRAGTFSKNFRIHKESNFLEQRLFPKAVWSVGLTFGKTFFFVKLLGPKEKRNQKTDSM